MVKGGSIFFRLCLLFLVLLGGVFWVSLQGAVSLPAGKVIAVFVNKILGISYLNEYPTVVEQSIVWDIRMPRIVLAILVGSALSVSGALIQGLFRNPLADPGIIGVSSGAAIGAAVMIVLGNRLLGSDIMEGLGAYAIPIASMIGALLITFIIYQLSALGGSVDLISMLLIGIAINALAGSFLGLLIFMASDDQLRTLTFWGLGSLARADWQMILTALPLLILPLIIVGFLARSLNALLLGEEEADSLGISVKTLKRLLIVTTAALVGTAVSVAGTIGFLSLVVPHIIRTATGPDHRFLIPASALLGALLLLVSDTLARQIVAPAELPIGIITALFGAPLFLGLLLQRKKSFLG